MKQTEKQTAVDWLIEQIENTSLNAISDELWFGIKGQAKELEKQQITQAYEQGQQSNAVYRSGESEYFYAKKIQP